MSGDALEALALQGDAIAAPAAADPAAPGSPGEPSGAIAPTGPEASPNWGAVCFLLTGFRELACLVLKVESPKVTLNDENVQRCAGALVPVADKYGLNLGSILDGPEAMALMVAGPILWGTYRAMDAELTARRAKKGDQAEAAPSSSSSRDA